METLNPEITDKETSKRNHQEKNDQKIHQIPNNPQPNISLSQLNTTIKQLSSDLNFLYLGLKFDHDANANASGDTIISLPDSKVKVAMICTNEELVIARDTMHLVQNME